MTAKKIMALVGRLVVSVGMLVLLVWKINQERHAHGEGNLEPILPPFNRETAGWLLLALALTFLSVVVSSLRWRAVLEALDVERVPRLRRLLSIYLAGLFVGNVLPSTVGGDVLRVARLSNDIGDTSASFASVVLERLTGWVVLPVLILSGLLVNHGLLELGRATRIALLIALGTLALLILVFVAMSHPLLGGRVGRAEGWRRFMGAVHFGMVRLRKRPLDALAILGWGFAYQLILVVAAYSAARTLDVEAIGFTSMLAFYPAVLIAQVLPISISGLGIREGLFVLFLDPLGVPGGKSVALGILLYLLTLVVSLLGAPAFALGARHRRSEEERQAVLTS